MPRARPEENTAPRGAPGDFEEIQVANKLKIKVGPGVGADPGAVDTAERIVESMKADYEKRLESEIRDLLEAFDKMRYGGDFDLDLLYDKSHEIRGEAGTFGYQLISDIGKLLCELLSPLEQASAAEIEAIGAHLKAMQTVVAQRVKGTGPEVAQQIVQGLNAIVKKSSA
ncbi:MAG: hypothetical protein QF384_21065 [Alphaproteobacteria bacterium]|jgi:hypothetical protein|nr:hypothetical protein [Alphaproteobacteria bacterium]MDP6832194.1 hypothetical protein [Alphaproteobacteria bacterium]MDP6874989.1 hypothetical protein [Alphaproteobacteria bacterium]